MKRLVRRIPSSQSPYHAFYGYPYFWGYDGNNNNYGYDDYGATDSSSDTAGGSWGGYDLGSGGDFGGCEGKTKKRLIKARTQDFSLIEDSNSYDLIKNDVEELKKNGYVMFNSSYEEKCGAKGLFAFQMPGNGVDKPIIYFLEIYQFSKRKGRISKNLCFLIEHRYDDKGKILSHQYKKVDGYTWKELYNEILSGFTLSDSNNVIGIQNCENFFEAKEIAEKEFIENRNEKILY